MEHREPPRIATADEPAHEAGGDPVRGRRFARFVTPPSVRRLSRTRIVLALVAGAALLYFLSLAGLYGLRSLRMFVHRQAEYQLKFGDIELDPPPPAWYRGGANRFLERVQGEAGALEDLSLLDLDLEQLRLAFQRDGWVRKARVEVINPNRVVVHLVYREPVALVRVEGSGRVLLDREAVILALDEAALDEVDLVAAAPLLLHRGTGREDPPPFDPRVGQTWKSAKGRNGLPELDESVLAGTNLADLVRSAQADDRAQGRPIRFPAVIHQSRTKLWVQSRNDLLVFWGMPPGEELPGEPTFPVKWKVLGAWIKHHQHATAATKSDRLFQLKGTEVVPYKP
jgi:hypothetical protein